jgi:chromosome segregation ATPase
LIVFCVLFLLIRLFSIPFHRVRKQKDLEEQLETMMRKAADAQKSISRLQEDVKQKQTVIIAQADETSRWRDKLRTAEVEVDKLKSSVSEKEKQLENLQNELKSQGEAKDKIIKEAENTITQVLHTHKKIETKTEQCF